MKGYRWPEAWDKLKAMRAAWRESINTFDQDPTLADLGDDVQAAMINAYEALIGLSMIKFEFLDQEPWLIFRAMDRAVVTRWIEQYDSKKANPMGPQPHRVSEHFCSPQGRWRAALEAYAGGGDMERALLEKLVEYFLIAGDETHGEGIHRDLSDVRRRSHNASTPHLFSTCRRKQNLREYDGVVERGMAAQYHLRFRHYKTMKQHRRRWWTNNRACKISFNHFARWMYHLDDFSLTDWRSLNQFCGKPGTVNRDRKLDSEFKHVKADLCTNVFSEGMTHSVPNPNAAPAPAAAEAPQPSVASSVAVDAPAVGAVVGVAGVESGETDLHFKVISTNPLATATIHWVDAKNAWAPMMVQHMVPWPFPVIPGQPVSRHVYRTGEPEIVDMASLFSLPAAWDHLHIWPTLGPSYVHGCFEIRDKALVRDWFS